jgi:hypothetical protein
MSFPFEQLMQDLAAYLQTPLGLERGVYSLTVPLTDGRHQDVFATIRRTDDGRDVIDFVSTVGPVRPGIDAWNLLETNGRATFTRITVERGIIFVVATQLLATAQPEEVLLMLREVAQVADLLEHDFFQKDEF